MPEDNYVEACIRFMKRSKDEESIVNLVSAGGESVLVASLYYVVLGVFVGARGILSDVVFCGAARGEVMRCCAFVFFERTHDLHS